MSLGISRLAVLRDGLGLFQLQLKGDSCNLSCSHRLLLGQFSCAAVLLSPEIAWC